MLCKINRLMNVSGLFNNDINCEMNVKMKLYIDLYQSF